MQNNPLVSIIIPVYNGANYLSEAIDSAIRQTYKNIEIIVINDGSIDQTESIALSYKDLIKYYRKENGGVASALNFGIQKMHGSYFSWLSHDDLYTSDKIEKQIKEISKYSADTILYSNYGVFHNNPADFYLVNLSNVNNFRYWITIKNILHGCTLLIPKAAFDRHGLFDTTLKTTQDYDMWFKLDYKFIHIPNMLVLARSHPEQGSIIMSEIAQRECDELITSFVNKLQPIEIIKGSNKTLSNGYLDIADCCVKRGFIKANLRALELSGVKHVQLKDPIREKKFMNLLQKIKHKIKSLLIKDNLIKIKNLTHCEDLQHKFTKVYENNLFAGRNSRSGEGSDLIQTEIIRSAIPKLIQKYKIESMIDAPCGDWYWMRKVNLGVKKYIGIDIVQKIIDCHNQLYGNDTISFKCLNLVDAKLPKVDLIFSRDFLVHLKYQDIMEILKKFKLSESTYLLTTTFTNRRENVDLDNLFWRPLNLEMPPFNFPKPLEVLNEGCTEDNGNFSDKSLMLWNLSDIPS